MDIALDTTDIDAALKHPLVRGLLDSTSDGAVVIDATTRRILSMNARARELLGYSEQEVLGGVCRATMNSPSCYTACPLTRSVERSNNVELDLVYRSRAGDKLLHAHTRMLVVRGPDGQPLAGIELFRDIGEVRELERQLRESRALQTAITPRMPECGPEQLTTWPARPLLPDAADLNLAALERAAIGLALERAGGNISVAAGLLGIDRTTLWRKLRRDPDLERRAKE